MTTSAAKTETTAIKTPKKRTTEADVLAYLTRKPEFFLKHATLLDELKLKRTEGNVTSLNIVRAQRKEAQAESLKTQKERLYRTAEANAQTAQNIFTCVEKLATVQTLSEFRKFVQTTLKTELNLDATRFFLIGEETTATTLSHQDAQTMAPYALTPRTLHDVEQRQIYGTTGKLMKSDLLLNLNNQALITLASKDETTFYEGQSLELATFLTNVLAATFTRISA